MAFLIFPLRRGALEERKEREGVKEEEKGGGGGRGEGGGEEEEKKEGDSCGVKVPLCCRLSFLGSSTRSIWTCSSNARPDHRPDSISSRT